ncbi:MAG TPA: Fis family transcriptional regulator [Candidatus Aphodousia faecigallinarum]|uniref:Putative Fis-like DNA-binding protein n=1 Tax=Candidatus Aphodousia faecigallinarum TaxID=2840677 RepID=A0A9D1IL01_9BURK|nr:Fis family transcriptional regulator [Candidatus Aphodousia faecigallinarum]
MKPADIQADDSLEAAVVRNLQAYFETLNGMRPHHELYPMVMQAVEKPLLEFAMKRTGHNKCAAAQLLGINRNTLHKKLQFYKLI